MSRPARFFCGCLITGIFLFSYAVSFFAAREISPGREASWVKIRVFDPKTPGTRIALNIPVGLVQTLLTSSPASARIDVDGREVELREIWVRLSRSDSRSPLELGDDEGRVQLWLE
jgi:hypothetical protein